MKPEKHPAPLHYAGCYSLDLYCDHKNEDHSFEEFPHQFTGRTFDDCAKPARKRGWQFHRDGTATCPKCTKALMMR